MDPFKTHATFVVLLNGSGDVPGTGYTKNGSKCEARALCSPIFMRFFLHVLYVIKRKPKKTFPLNESKEAVSPIKPKETEVLPSKEALSWNEVSLQEVLREREREREKREMITGAVSLFVFQPSIFVFVFCFFVIFFLF